jgi:protocatechuate 3,4-dioxygenase beta subunit
MRKDRRIFVAGAGALLGSAMCKAGIALAGTDRQGPPRSKAGWEEYLRRGGNGQYTCVRTVQTTEGPFYYPSSLARRTLAEDHAGLKLRLGITVTGFAPGARCPPLTGAVVDIWHTDASGQYSNVGSDLQSTDAIGQTFCRGHQFTDNKGYVEFDTVVPGWEIVPSPAPIVVVRRTTHIHVKVFKDRSIATTQLYLPDPFLTELYAGTAPYRSHRLMTAPGLDRSYERISNTKDLLFTADRSTPMTIQRNGDTVVATARIGVVIDDSAGHTSLWS